MEASQSCDYPKTFQEGRVGKNYRFRMRRKFLIESASLGVPNGTTYLRGGGDASSGLGADGLLRGEHRWGDGRFGRSGGPGVDPS